MVVALLGPCFKTGRLNPFCQQPILRMPSLLDHQTRIRSWRKTPSPRHVQQTATLAEHEEAVLNPAECPHRMGYKFPKTTFPSGLCTRSKIAVDSQTSRLPHSRNNRFKRFPFSNFTYCLTLSSEFFSSFPHGTCSLSVSCLYLALDGIYHPFWIAFPNNPTLWSRPHNEWKNKTMHGVVTLSDFGPEDPPCSNGLLPSPSTRKTGSTNYNSLTLRSEISNLGFSRFIRHYSGNPC